MLSTILRHGPILPIVALIADATTTAVDATAPFMPLVNVGALGCVLLWFLLRAEPRLRAIEASNDRQTRAMLLLGMAIQGVPQFVKDQAREIINEIDTKK